MRRLDLKNAEHISSFSCASYRAKRNGRYLQIFMIRNVGQNKKKVSGPAAKSKGILTLPIHQTREDHAALMEWVVVQLKSYLRTVIRKTPNPLIQKLSCCCEPAEIFNKPGPTSSNWSPSQKTVAEGSDKSLKMISNENLVLRVKNAVFVRSRMKQMVDCNLLVIPISRLVVL